MKYLRDAWYLAAWSDEVKEGELFPRTVLDRPVLLMRGSEGRVGALDDRCPHRFAPLSLGRFDGSTITCGYHGLKFNTSGMCTGNPHGKGRIPRTAIVASHPVVERHGAIWLWVGDADADTSLIPDYSHLDVDDAVTRRDHLVMDVPHDLIIDNLLDCSHTSFLHEGILGNEGMLPTSTDVSQDGTTINVRRFSQSVPVPGMFAILVQSADGDLCDTWTDIRWDPPSHLLLDVGVTAPGRPREEGAGYFGVHILTPQAAATTHYFTTAIRWGIHPGTETEETRLKISDLRRYAFEEQDEPMIRAQHANIAAFARCDGAVAKPVLLETDAGVVRWRRIMEELLAGERKHAERVS